MVASTTDGCFRKTELCDGKSALKRAIGFVVMASRTKRSQASYRFCFYCFQDDTQWHYDCCQSVRPSVCRLSSYHTLRHSVCILSFPQFVMDLFQTLYKYCRNIEDDHAGF